MPRRMGGAGAVVLAVVVGWGTPARAQEVRWRQDYAAARKEAAAAGRPLLLDFGNDGCVWCRKLDATTFRDRGVVALLNERVIPVKVDGTRDEWLARAAGVEAYPTLVLVAADGKVVARHEGYADAAKMTAFLRKAPAPEAAAPPPADLLAPARADHDAGRYLACVGRCDRVMSDHPDTPAAAEARSLSARISGDAQKWRRVTDQLRTDLSALHRDLDAALRR